MQMPGGHLLAIGWTMATHYDLSKGQIGNESVRGRARRAGESVRGRARRADESVRGRTRRGVKHVFHNLQLEKQTPNRYNMFVFARQILKRRSARCSSSLVATAATMTAAPSGRFSARFAVSAADTITCGPAYAGPSFYRKTEASCWIPPFFVFNILQASVWKWFPQLFLLPGICGHPGFAGFGCPGRRSPGFSEPGQRARR